MWSTDDSTAAGTLHDLKEWWDETSSLGPSYGYFPNRNKTYLIVKPEYVAQATSLFAEQGIQVTAEDHIHLGAAIGSTVFREEFVRKHVDE